MGFLFDADVPQMTDLIRSIDTTLFDRIEVEMQSAVTLEC
jgi:hypothetical protein